jgi:hypothetical protein
LDRRGVRYGYSDKRCHYIFYVRYIADYIRHCSLERESPKGTPKLFLRTLLFTTGTKGRVIENMFLKIHQEYGSYKFDFWGHTENGKLTLGSGLFVGAMGIVCDHHFNPGKELSDFLFVSGEYRVEVFATIVGQKKPERLMQLTFVVDGQQAAELIQIPMRELYLLWNAETRNYEGHVERDHPHSVNTVEKAA